MNFVQDAIKTESKLEKLSVNPRVTIATIEMATAAAEIADAMKKLMFYGKPVDKEALMSAFDRVSLFSGSLNRDIQDETLVGGDFVRESETEGMSPESIVSINALARCSTEKLNLRLLHAALGIFTEAGELFDAVAKAATGIQELDLVNFAEEIGDVMWYAAIASDETGMPFEKIQEAVIAKLKKRYGDKFDSGKAVNRDVAAEREVLESSVAQ